MGFEPIQIQPIDLDESVAVGVNLPFSSPSVFSSNYQTRDSTKNNLINFFLTNPGERPLNPTFGGGLRSFLFEQMDKNNLEFLKDDVSEKTSKYFPNVKIEELTVTGKPDTNTIHVSMTYSLLQTNITDTLQITFNG
jgi:phage baseplate assembly protein W